MKLIIFLQIFLFHVKYNRVCTCFIWITSSSTKELLNTEKLKDDENTQGNIDPSVEFKHSLSRKKFNEILREHLLQNKMKRTPYFLWITSSPT